MSDLLRLSQAYYFAAEKHKNQRRKGEDAEPYINHPAHVAHILAAANADIDVVIAGILHDTVEDTETSYDELVEVFGQKIADIVMEVSDDKNLPKQERKKLQITKMAKKSAEAKKVKLADKISNLEAMSKSPPAGWAYDRKKEYFEWARSVINNGRGTCEILEKRFDDVYQEGIEFLQKENVA